MNRKEGEMNCRLQVHSVYIEQDQHISIVGWLSHENRVRHWSVLCVLGCLNVPFFRDLYIYGIRSPLNVYPVFSFNHNISIFAISRHLSL